MRAIVQDRYGSPEGLVLREVERPPIGDDEVLVEVRAASVHPDVWHVVTGRPFVLRLMGSGLRRPKYRVPGTDLAGVVTAVGRSVTGFRPGDEVFGESMRGLSWRNGGAFAEYAAAPEEALAVKPANVTFEQAAAVATAGYITLLNLPTGRLEPGQRILVNGAGGGVGAIAVQLAKAHGAHVTGVDHGGKLDLVRSLGADQVIDYTREDFTRTGQRYDLVVDMAGSKTLREMRRVLTPTGVLVGVGGPVRGNWIAPFVGTATMPLYSLFGRQSMTSMLARTNREDLGVLCDLLDRGEITPVIDRTYPLPDVPEAVRYLEAGHARGKVVITLA